MLACVQRRTLGYMLVSVGRYCGAKMRDWRSDMKAIDRCCWRWWWVWPMRRRLRACLITVATRQFVATLWHVPATFLIVDGVVKQARRKRTGQDAVSTLSCQMRNDPASPNHHVSPASVLVYVTQWYW